MTPPPLFFRRPIIHHLATEGFAKGQSIVFQTRKEVVGQSVRLRRTKQMVGRIIASMKTVCSNMGFDAMKEVVG
ncbi:MAG TPA: hypothetical protein DHV16_07475 [Nitrospiraceae bacterium]|nr:hypothetical protein [Nitrospiraceae bacterium]